MMKEQRVAFQTNGAARLCPTRDSIDIGNWQRESSCKTDFSNRSSSSLKSHTVCAEADSDGEAVFANPENYTIKTSTTLKMGGKTKTSQRTMKAQ